MAEFIPTVLIVEDQPGVRDLFDQLVSRDACRTLLAEGVDASRRLIDSERIDLAIIDYWLPDGYGSEVIDHLQRVHPGAQSIVVTALGPDQRVDEMIKRGALAHVKKPFDVDALRAQIQRALTLCHLAHENKALQAHIEGFNEEVRLRGRELEAIQRLAGLTNEVEDFGGQGEEALAVLADLLGPGVALAYFVAYEANDRYLLRHHLGLAPAERDALARLRAEGGLIGRAGAERRIVAADEPAGAALGVADPSGAPAAIGRIRSALALPVSSRGQPIGILLAGCAEEDARRRAGELLEGSVGRFFAVAMENAYLSEIAAVDILTTLYNRGYFEARIDQEVSRAQRYGSRLALCLADVDRFKSLNDGFGHQFGDRVLRELGRSWKRGLRKSDFAARYGGEELALVLPETTLEGARRVAEKIRGEVEALKFRSTNGRGPAEVGVTVSIGVACFPDQASTVEEIVRAADRALYEAKGRGGNKVICFGEAEGGA